MWTWLRELYEDAAAGRRGPTHHPAWRLLLEVVHIVVVLVQETMRDRLHVRAAMLAYWTAVAIVPLLMLGFALTGPLALADETRDAVRHLLYDTILASSVEELGAALDDLILRTNLRTLGTIGVLSTMFIGSQLFFNMELAYNDIFRARVDRSWILRFTLFYACLTLGPVLLAAGVVLSSRLGADAVDFPLGAHLLPLAASAPAFVAALRLLPCSDVSWKASITGGVVTAVLFEAAKLGFGVYLDVFGTRDNLAVIYGSVAFLPVFLIWTYVSWLVVLFGVEVAYLVQHHGSLLDAQRRLAIDRFARRRRPDGFFALAVMSELTLRFQDGRGPTKPSRIADALGANPRHVLEVIEILKDADLLVLTDDRRVLPAHAPDRVTRASVLRAWRIHAAPKLRGHAAESLAPTYEAVERVMESLPVASPAQAHHDAGTPPDRAATDPDRRTR